MDEARVGATNSRWLTGLVLLGVPGVMFHRSLFGGEALFGRDMAPFFYPMKYFLVDAVRGGQLPLWNPWILNGEPFFASLQPGLLYPGSLLLYLLPLPFAVSLVHALHYCVAGLGMYVLLRRWRNERPAALAGSLAFMAGGYLLSVGNFTNNLQTVALLPWVFWAWSRFLATGERRDWLIFTAACCIAFLGGEPQMLALGLGLLLAHGLLAVEGIGPVGRLRQLGAVGLAGLLAAAIVAVQLLPFVEYLGESVRVLQLDYDFAARHSLGPAALSQLLVPPVLGGGPHGFSTQFLPTPNVPWLLSIYPGVLVICLALIGLSAPRSRRWGWFWGSVTLVGLALALGRHLPLHGALYEALPPLRLVRYPEKFYFYTAFALPVLAAGGLSGWMGSGASGTDGAREADKHGGAGGERGRARATLVILGTMLAILLALTTLAATWSSLTARACGSPLFAARLCGDPVAAQRAYLGHLLLLTMLVGAALCVSWLLARRRIGSGLALGVLIALIALDLIAAGRNVNPTVSSGVYRQAPWAARVLDAQAADASPRSIGAQPTRTEFRYRGTPLAAQMGSTVVVPGAEDLSNLFLWYEALGPNLGQVFRHLTQDGLQGVELLGVAETIDVALQATPQEAVRLLRAMSVRYYADPTPAADEIPGLTLLARHPDLPLRMFEVSDPRPRAYVVGGFEVVEDPSAALRATLEPAFPLSSSVVLDRVPESPPESGASGRVVQADYGLNRVEVEVDTDGAGLLVLTDRHYPGWTASVNGEMAPIYRAAGYFRAVSLPPGRSHVVFRFVPRSAVAGSILSAIGLLLFVGLALTSRRPTADAR